MTVNGKRLEPRRVYRKVVPGSVKNLVLEDTDDVWAEEADGRTGREIARRPITVITIKKTKTSRALKDAVEQIVRRGPERLFPVQEMLQRLSGGKACQVPAFGNHAPAAPWRRR